VQGRHARECPGVDPQAVPRPSTEPAGIVSRILSELQEWMNRVRLMHDRRQHGGWKCDDLRSPGY
jgi:hypothetical protein